MSIALKPDIIQVALSFANLAAQSPPLLQQHVFDWPGATPFGELLLRGVTTIHFASLPSGSVAFTFGFAKK